jgi:Holliday junction resolvasome RuvABC ATP-dependent DNA helicase subunit
MNNNFIFTTDPPYKIKYPYNKNLVTNKKFIIKVNKDGSIDELDYYNFTNYTLPIKTINLNLKINSLNDLIILANDYDTKYSKLLNYNINLEMINSLKDELYELEALVGQEKIKKEIVDLIVYYSLEMNNGQDDILHTIIDGSPGSGKTHFAHILAKIYLKLGVLRNNIFKKVRRSDLIAGYLGQTAIKTQSILDEVKGGVLFIDEAYSIGNAEGKDTRDLYSKECIDLLNQSLTEMVTEKDKYFICIIAGYRDDLIKNFFSFNDGLERRFSVHFRMEPYSDLELFRIFSDVVKNAKWTISSDVDHTFITKNRSYFIYAGGDMNVLFTKCKICHSKNYLQNQGYVKKRLTKLDIEDGVKLFINNRKNIEIYNNDNSMYS